MLGAALPALGPRRPDHRPGPRDRRRDGAPARRQGHEARPRRPRARALQALAAELRTDTATFECDVTDWDALRAAVAGTVERWAGSTWSSPTRASRPGGPIRTIEPEAFEATIEVNLLGVWRTVRTALPHVIERKRLRPADRLARRRDPHADHRPLQRGQGRRRGLRRRPAHRDAPHGVDVGCALLRLPRHRHGAAPPSPPRASPRRRQRAHARRRPSRRR